MPKSPEEMAAAMIANMKEKTGKTLEDWLAIAKRTGAEKHGEIVKALKSDHGMTHGFANLVAHKLLKSDAASKSDDGEDLLATQYGGAKAGLKPIYDAIATAASSFGNDVEFAPKKAYVSLRRSKQFALVQPSTRTRVDLGLYLADQAPAGRLEASGCFNAMVSHRIRLVQAEDVDSEVISWLRKAYEEAG